MAATTYTGTGATQSISNAVNGVSMQPDFVWIKSRSNAENHNVVDSIRGAGVWLASNLTQAETNDTGSYGVSTFNSNGFTVISNGTRTNASGYTYVGWQWKAGGTAVSNTSGSITSQVSANATAGFSVVTYTGNGTSGTIGHGLGVAPQMIIVKRRSAAQDWIVAHIGIGGTGGMGNNFMYLNQTGGNAGPYAGCFNNTLPTTSVFSVGNDTSTNASGSTYVAYCFAAVAGFSAFGSYTGNGSTDGPFVYLGFRPRFFMYKRTDSAGSWVILDSSRNPSNVTTQYLYPNASDAEASATFVDFVSNGVKFRTTYTDTNGSGATYVYACFAENAFKFANAR
jgi:hypothetical protein